MKTVAWALTLVSMVAGAAVAASGNPLVEQVRAANNRFKDVKVAVAKG